MSMSHKIVQLTIFAATLGGLTGTARWLATEFRAVRYGRGGSTGPEPSPRFASDQPALIHAKSTQSIRTGQEVAYSLRDACGWADEARSSWSPEMFKVGMHIEVDGHPHRTDPNACYTENFHGSAMRP